MGNQIIFKEDLNQFYLDTTIQTWQTKNQHGKNQLKTQPLTKRSRLS